MEKHRLHITKLINSDFIIKGLVNSKNCMVDNEKNLLDMTRLLNILADAIPWCNLYMEFSNLHSHSHFVMTIMVGAIDRAGLAIVNTWCHH